MTPAALARRLCAAVLLLAVLMPARPDGIDLHAYWDSRCAGCHGDAGEFARRTLRVEGGKLLGYHQGERLERFLRQHYLADALVPRVMAMLQAQVETEPLFAGQCRRCHGPASAFARQSLQWRDGVLTGREAGRPVQETLRRHGGLDADEAARMLRTLARLLDEVGGGAARAP
ncbi:MAG: hypothetical protein U1F56_19045 [Rubrivivax sp.]